jgi:predicted transcriptional regulator
MKELTKAEEQIMHMLWDMKQAYIKDLVDRFPEPKPAYTTVSTIVRILEKKVFVGYRAHGRIVNPARIRCRQFCINEIFPAVIPESPA